MLELFKMAGVVTVEGVDVVASQLQGLEKSARSALKPLVKFGREAERVGTKLTKTLTVPIAGIGVAAVKMAGDFEKAMTTSTAIMSGVNDEMRQQLEDTAREISKESTFSAKELAEAYYFLASAGLSVEQSLSAIGKVAKFAEAGQFDLKTATDLLTDAQSALGLVTDNVVQNEENMVRVSDALVKGATLANATVQEFSEALTNKAANSLRLLGKDVEEGIAVLASYADQGVKGAKAGEQFAIALRDLQNAYRKGSDTFKKYGIAVYDANEEMRFTPDIIKDIEKALENKSDLQKKLILAELGFQERSVQSLLTLVGTADKMGETYNKLINETGSTAEVAEKQIANFKDQLKLLYHRLQDVAIELGESLLPILKDDLFPIVEKIISGLSKMADGFTDWNDGAKKLTISIAALLAVAGPLLVIIGKLSIGAGVVAELLAGLKVIVTGLTAVFSGIGLVITSVVGSIALLVTKHRELNSEKRLTNKLSKIQKKLMTAEGEEAKKLQEKYEDTAQALADYNSEKEKMIAQREAVDALHKTEQWQNATTEERIKLLDELSQRLDMQYKKGMNSQQGLAMMNAQYGELNKVVKTNTENTDENTDSTDLNAEAKTKLQEKIEEAKLKDLQLNRDIQNELAKMDEKEEQDEKDKHDQLMKNIREYREEKEKERKADEKKDKDAIQKKKDYYDELHRLSYQSATMAIDALQMQYNNESILIDNNYKRRQKAIENSTMSEEQKSKALEKLDNEFDKKRAAIQKKQMIANKAQSLFDIYMSTRTAIMKAWEFGPVAGPVFSGIIAALGAVQAALVASQPIPEMAEGGIIPKSQGGRLVRAGEAGQDEGFIPMKTGTASIAHEIINNMRRFPFGGQEAMAGRFSTGSTVAGGVNLNIGTLIADDKGISELERRMKVFRVAENNRLGIA